MGVAWLALSFLIGLFPAVPSTPSSNLVAAVSTACDALADTTVPADAVIGGFGPSQFLADVDGDGHKDVVTGYWTGNADPELADHFLHVELASGWGTAIRIDDLAQFSSAPMATPARVVGMAGQRLIVAGVQRTLVGADYALFSFRDCALAPVPLVAGGYPEIWSGGGLMHSEWFACRADGVVMLDLFRGLDDQGQVIPGVLVGGEALSYQLNPNGFGSPATVDLGLPRTDVDLHGEYPDCAEFVGSFVDDDASVFQTAIEWLALEGITKGCNPPVNDRFCPERTLSRGEMAAFLVRAMGYVDDGGGNRFVDDDASVFESAIDKLAAAGVTQGCNPPLNDRFCPERRVTRGEMAAFLVRAMGYVDDGGGDRFVDDDGSVFESAIDRLATAGVTQGCNPPVNDRFCPEDSVTRGQLAAFLNRALE
ncbi:MAG: hypothetical protein ABW021_09590 [Acidimicrobiia bacterium]